MPVETSPAQTGAHASGSSGRSVAKTVHQAYVIGMQAFAELVSIATDQHGLVTVADAGGVGLEPHRLRRWAAEGLLSRVSHGVYRVEAVAGDRLAQQQAALLWPRCDAVLVGETALDLHDLSDIIPARMHIAVPAAHRLRRTPPAWLRVHRRDIPNTDRTVMQGLAVVTRACAILDAVDFNLGDRFINEAVDAARRRRELTEHDELRIELARVQTRQRALQAMMGEA